MVQASSFLLLLALSAVMIQGAPLTARFKEHPSKDDATAVQSKLQENDVRNLYEAGVGQTAGDAPIVASRPPTDQTSNCMTQSNTQPQQGTPPQQDTGSEPDAELPAPPEGPGANSPLGVMSILK
ncbi:hypothetical protein BCR42DRAFT_421398 [Absidia repens]|uniref:Uncharacterized protein n=1 Tax=Absidia repens TaxID=90262 RepID=A0A1X2I8U2_9FUNG|nr:hypothetical protein BCR42DRAFT_421398 [Absidia repens]